MSFHAVLMGCNVISYEKIGVKYAMVCAWTTMVDFDKIVMLLGSQSVTGKNLFVGDYVGVSALASDQMDACLRLGSTHSDEDNKFKGVPYTNDHGVITIDGAKNRMVCEVLKIEELEEGDRLVSLRIDSYIEDKEKSFLHLDEVLKD